jgi:uroporphyrinogen decarboxylase
MLSPADLRRLVFPWHKKCVQTIHDAGKPAILHSCGQLEAVMDDIIDGMKFDGKHSYEDKICPVEQMYEKYGSRIAILGGLDMDFVCRSTPEAVHARAQAMLKQTAKKGAYALGTGNSVPSYVPPTNYFAMISAATGIKYDERPV